MKNITVLTESRLGVVADISQLLGDNNINILTLDVEGMDDHGLIQLTVDHYDRALQLFKQAGLRAISEDALVIRVPDEPGGCIFCRENRNTH